MTKQTKSAILLYNGDFFDFKDPRNHNYDIRTIAHALSNLCRYTGHTKRFYSVAEHSVVVSHLVPERYALDGLMHDASEAFVGDVSSPLKRLLPGYKKIEDGIQEAIAVHFGLYWPHPPEIKEGDILAYVTERKSISNTGQDGLWYTDIEPANIEIKGLRPKQAYDLFISRYEELTDGCKGYEKLRSKTAKRDTEAEPYSTRLAVA